MLWLEEGPYPDVGRSLQDEALRPQDGGKCISDGLTSGFRYVDEDESVPMGNDQESTCPLKCQDSPTDPVWLPSQAQCLGGACGGSVSTHRTGVVAVSVNRCRQRVIHGRESSPTQADQHRSG